MLSLFLCVKFYHHRPALRVESSGDSTDPRCIGLACCATM